MDLFEIMIHAIQTGLIVAILVRLGMIYNKFAKIDKVMNRISEFLFV